MSLYATKNDLLPRNVPSGHLTATGSFYGLYYSKRPWFCVAGKVASAGDETR